MFHEYHYEGTLFVTYCTVWYWITDHWTAFTLNEYLMKGSVSLKYCIYRAVYLFRNEFGKEWILYNSTTIVHTMYDIYNVAV